MITILARAAALALLAFAIPVHGQAVKAPRVGIVMWFTQEQLDRRQVPVQGPFEEGLRERGWVPGRNIELLYRPSTSLEELLKLPVDVIVTFGLEHLDAIKLTTQVPIVASLGPYDADQRIAEALRRPGTNLTGVGTASQGALATKRLAMLKEVTGAGRVARLYIGEPLRFGTMSEMIPEYAAAARSLGLEVFPVWANTPQEMRTAFAELARRKPIAVLIPPFGRLPGREALWDAMIEGMEREKIVIMSDTPLAASQGVVMGYGDNIPDRARRMAYFVDRILRGAKPADLPPEQLDQLHLIVNMKAAGKMGVKIPTAILIQAEGVIR